MAKDTEKALREQVEHVRAVRKAHDRTEADVRKHEAEVHQNVVKAVRRED